MSFNSRFLLAVVLIIVADLGTGVPAHGVGSCNLSETESVQALPSLCAVTTVRGSVATRMNVNLSEEVTLEPSFTGPGSDITIEGKGAFIGFALRKHSPAREMPIGVVAGRFPKQSTANPPDVSSPFLLFDLAGTRDNEPVTLPSGTYTLYLLATGSPVEITIRFGNLEGESQLAPTDPVEFDARRIWPQVALGDTVFVGAETGELASSGLLIGVLWSIGLMVENPSQLCMYEGEPREPEVTGEGCTTSGNLPGGSTAFEIRQIGLFDPGVYSATARYANVGVMDDAGVVAVWFSFH